jgi:serine/threonine protein kinase
MTQQVDTIDDYILIKTVGRGSQASVKLSVHIESGTEVALKVFKKRK